MRKNVKIIVGVVVLILVLVVGSFVGLIINRTNDHKFGRYVSTEGPWGMTATWVSEDSASYLVCKKENDEPFANVTAYFQGVDGWQAYELNSIDRIPPRVEYSLTDKGRSVVPILKSICQWSGTFYKEDNENEMTQCQKCDHRG